MGTVLLFVFGIGLAVDYIWHENSPTQDHIWESIEWHNKVDQASTRADDTEDEEGE